MLFDLLNFCLRTNDPIQFYISDFFYELGLLKIYQNQSRKNIRFLEGTNSKIVCITSLFQLKIIGKRVLVKKKISQLEFLLN